MVLNFKVNILPALKTTRYLVQFGDNYGER